jgi:flagellar basal-body rod protein FlgB
MAGIFDRDISLLERSLDFRAKRNNLLSGNIANIETPGYKAKDLVFEQALGQALRSQEPGPMNTTHPRHLDGRMATPLSQVQPRTIQSANPVGSVDGNSVDLEREMAKLAENQIAYQSLAQMISLKFLQLRTVIREGD